MLYHSFKKRKLHLAKNCSTFYYFSSLLFHKKPFTFHKKPFTFFGEVSPIPSFNVCRRYKFFLWKNVERISFFFLNLNYNDNIKWIWWISFLIKYNFKIIYWRYTNVDLLFNIISRLKYVFISYQIFINTSCKNIVAYTWSFSTYFSELKKFFTHQLIDMMVFIQRQTDCCI